MNKKTALVLGIIIFAFLACCEPDNPARNPCQIVQCGEVKE